MNERTILDVHRLPARLDVRQTAILLGFQEHDIPILMRTKLLKPLGDPAQNGHKFFSAGEIETLSRDRSWLDKASKAVTKQRKRIRSGPISRGDIFSTEQGNHSKESAHPV